MSTISTSSQSIREFRAEGKDKNMYAKILAYMNKRKKATKTQIAQHIGCYEEQVAKRLPELGNMGYLIKTDQRIRSKVTGRSQSVWQLIKE